LAALGLASKSFLYPLARFLLSTFLIPGGVLFGGLYMIWLLLARSLVNRIGSATLTAFIQGTAAFALGLSSAPGLFCIFIYLLPGIVVDSVFILLSVGGTIASLLRFTLSGALANLVGIATVAMTQGFAGRPLALLMAVGSLSGALGGLAAFFVSRKIPPIFFSTRAHLPNKKSGMR
jgi:hypothetical protein